ncbi:MAG: RluA family pseudouridine synthase [Planctomycetes bacterium]|nr:RluA family pseudouridine synthase [Planctomycetota bacterium]
MSFEKNTASVKATPACAGFRADRALCALAPKLTRRAAKTLFHAGAVKLNGKSAKGSERVEAGDRFEFPDPEAPEGRALFDQARAPRLTTSHGRQVARLYEDDAVLVINKPAEIPVHRNQDGLTRRETLEDVLERAYPPKNHCGLGISDFGLNGKGAADHDDPDAEPSEDEIQNPKSKIPNAVPGFFFCHRLDMETTGCLLVAKTTQARDALIRDFEKRRMGKQYLAIAVGAVPWERKAVERPIKYIRKEQVEGGLGGPPHRRGATPDWVRRKKYGKPQRALKVGVALDPGDPAGKSCETVFSVLRRYKGYTVLKCEPKTGRMHQIRVHLSSEGFPLAYDQVYGRRSPLRLREFDLRTCEKESGETIVLNRLPLHAWKLKFTHPLTGEKMEIEAPVPRDLKEFLQVLKKYRAREDGSYSPQGRGDAEKK